MKTKNVIWISLLWASLIIISYSWNYYIAVSNINSIVENKAESFFSQILVTRAWNSSHGGIYVPVTDKTQPNPYLSDSLRDITTNSGMKLTKINPAYMTRQIAEINKIKNDLQFHITSLNPIRPANKADEWETKALLSFADGAKNALELVKSDAGSSYRYMAPLLTEQSCLKCHAVQGYKVGEIRGGISISFPSRVYMKSEKRLLLNLLLAHFLIFIAGIFGIYRYFNTSNKFYAIIEQKNLKLEEDGLLLRQSNRNLQESLELHRATVSAMPDILFSLNHKGYFTSCQVSDSNFLLFPKDVIIGKSLQELLPPEIANKGTDAISKAIETGELQIFEYKLVLPIGQRWFEMRIVNSSHNEVLAISRDITERKLAEEEIQQKNEQLTATIADKNRFMSILAHDLRSPFNAILGYLGLLSQNVRNYDIDTIEKQVKIINFSANKAFNLLEDILLWARAQSGKIPYNPEEIELTAVINDIIEFLKPSASFKNITVNLKETRLINAYADLEMVKTVLRNLISNSVKFTRPGGQIDVSAELVNSEIQVSVSDNGVGLSKESLEKLFDISAVHSTAGTDKESGTGLGLVICREFVEKNGGKIWVKSEEGYGSTFTFSIPVR